jgi:hypothetical protein
MFDIRGSGEQRSIHGLEYAMICDRVSLGVKGVSNGSRGGMIGAGGMEPELESVCDSSERYAEIKVKTLEWK